MALVAPFSFCSFRRQCRRILIDWFGEFSLQLYAAFAIISISLTYWVATSIPCFFHFTKSHILDSANVIFDLDSRLRAVNFLEQQADLYLHCTSRQMNKNQDGRLNHLLFSRKIPKLSSCHPKLPLKKISTASHQRIYSIPFKNKPLTKIQSSTYP